MEENEQVRFEFSSVDKLRNKDQDERDLGKESKQEEEEEDEEFEMFVRCNFGKHIRALTDAIKSMCTGLILTFEPEHFSMFSIGMSKANLMSILFDKNEFEVWDVPSTFQFSVSAERFSKCMKNVINYQSIIFAVNKSQELIMILSDQRKQSNLMTKINQMDLDYTDERKGIIQAQKFEKNIKMVAEQLTSSINDIKAESSVVEFTSDFKSIFRIFTKPKIGSGKEPICIILKPTIIDGEVIFGGVKESHIINVHNTSQSRITSLIPTTKPNALLSVNSMSTNNSNTTKKRKKKETNEPNNNKKSEDTLLLDLEEIDDQDFILAEEMLTSGPTSLCSSITQNGTENSRKKKADYLEKHQQQHPSMNKQEYAKLMKLSTNDFFSDKTEYERSSYPAAFIAMFCRMVPQESILEILFNTNNVLYIRSKTRYYTIVYCLVCTQEDEDK